MRALKTHNPENWIIRKPFKQAPIRKPFKQAPIRSTMAVKTIRKLQRLLYWSLNRHLSSPNLRHTHQSMIVKLLRKQDWEDLLCVSFPHSSTQKAISSLYFFVSTSGFLQCLCYNQAITMIYKGHVIEKMANVYKKTFSVRLKICEAWGRIISGCGG